MTEASTHISPAGQGAPHYNYRAFVWHELGTTQVEAAVTFYTSLFGWTVQKMPMGEHDYRMFYLGEKPVGGLFDMPAGSPSYWNGAISVPDVDAAAKTAQEAGGSLLAEPQDVPGMLRFAVVADPLGGVFTLCRNVHGDPEEGMPQVGEFSWDQLNTPNPDAAGAFYEKVIGWTLPASAGEHGVRVFHNGDLQEASVAQAPEGVPAHWVPHVVVENLPTALKKAADLGATLMVERIDVPGMGAFGVIQDPVGAVLSLFGPAMDF